MSDTSPQEQSTCEMMPFDKHCYRWMLLHQFVRITLQKYKPFYCLLHNFEFQNCLRIALGEKHREPPELNMHPRLRKMKYMARYRDKIKAKKDQGGLDL